MKWENWWIDVDCGLKGEFHDRSDLEFGFILSPHKSYIIQLGVVTIKSSSQLLFAK